VPSADVLASLRRLARTPLDASALGSSGAFQGDSKLAEPCLTRLLVAAGADVIALALRIRAVTAVEVPTATDLPLVETELLEGSEKPADLDEDERAEQRAIRKLSVQDAALRTLRLAQQPGVGGKRGGSSRAPVPAAKKPSAPKKARTGAVERAGPGDTYEQKLAGACADFKGSEGRLHFKGRLARTLERQGIEVGLARQRERLRCFTRAHAHFPLRHLLRSWA